MFTWEQRSLSHVLGLNIMIALLSLCTLVCYVMSLMSSSSVYVLFWISSQLGACTSIYFWWIPIMNYIGIWDWPLSDEDDHVEYVSSTSRINIWVMGNSQYIQNLTAQWLRGVSHIVSMQLYKRNLEESEIRKIFMIWRYGCRSLWA